jgi:hypothetical protein
VPGYNGPAALDEQIRLAEFLALAERVIPEDYRGKAGDLLALIHQAQALDIPVMTAIANLFFEPDGSGGMSAQLMGALLRRGGADWSITSEPGMWCELHFTFRDGRTAGTSRYTIGHAMTAEVAGSINWVRYPDDNLYARALSRGARRYAQDIVAGLGYTRGELRDTPPDAGPVDQPAGDVAEHVTAFLTQITEDTTADAIRALIKVAKSRKVDVADEHAGGGQTVEQRLNELWRIAAAREAAAREVSADRADEDATTSDVDGPPGAAVLDAPAGDGTLPCGCTAAAVVSAGVHTCKVDGEPAAG